MKTISAAAFLLVLAVIPTLSQEGTPRDGESPSNHECSVYAKVLLPGKAPAAGKHAVELWIARRLEKHGAPEVRAVTGWVRLPEGAGRSVTVWDGVLDGRGGGCHVEGHIGKRSDDGRVHVTLSGWAPFPPNIKGTSLLAEIGSRRIAVVDTGRTDGVKSYVALMIAPAIQNSGERDGAHQSAAASGQKPKGKGKPKHHPEG